MDHCKEVSPLWVDFHQCNHCFIWTLNASCYTTILFKTDRMALFKTLACDTEWPVANKLKMKHSTTQKFLTSNVMSTRWQWFISLSVSLSPSHLDEQCFCYEGKIQQKQPMTEQNNIKILTPDLTIFLIDPAETTMSNKIVVHFAVQFHFPESWKRFLHPFPSKFVYVLLLFL